MSNPGVADGYWERIVNQEPRNKINKRKKEAILPAFGS